LKLLNSSIKIDVFFRQLSIVSNQILFLDYDGTLAPFHTQPDKAFPYPGISDLIEKIQNCQKTRVVIVSGRSIKDILPLLNLKNKPEIWGSHGLERLKCDNTYLVEYISPMIQEIFTKAREYTKGIVAPQRLEDKPGCLALHWRGLKKDLVMNIKETIHPIWQRIADQEKMFLKEFDGGLELRVPGKDKGDAIHQVLSEIQGEFMSAYLGDDKTDEDAFAALNNRGLRVLVRKELRETQADLWLEPPAELKEFLKRWLEACQ
jgi:trehalose-phosphatase